ncbi:MAG TPA: PAS domain-containing protein, partial [Fimbriimonadaceae bacterium]|nr:PAS domain-containing protein [Fimbriimonadaceae bacterium]
MHTPNLRRAVSWIVALAALTLLTLGVAKASGLALSAVGPQTLLCPAFAVVCLCAVAMIASGVRRLGESERTLGETADLLRESEISQRAILDNLALGVMLCRSDGSVKRVNPAWGALHFPAAQLRPGDNLTDTLAASSDELSTRMLGAISSGKREVSGEASAEDGRIVRRFSYRMTRLAGLGGGLIVSCEDVTSRRQIEEVLKQSERRFRIACELAKNHIYEVDLATGTVLSFSGELFRVANPGIELRTTDDLRNLIHPEDRETAIGRIRAAIRLGVDFDQEFRVMLPSGEIRWWSAHGHLARLEDDSV